MKRWFPLVVFLTVAASVAQAESVQQVYARGVRAYSGGNLEQAQKLFREVLAADPGNQPAALYLQRIAAEKPKNVDLRKQMEGVIVPKIDFRDTSLTTVLDFLPKVVAEQTGGHATLNIVRMFSSDYGREKLITLQLSGVPVTSVLDYVAQLANVKVAYQAHAVVISAPQTVAAQ
ncbi:MAG TPA: hypothetical protein VIM61_14150 [Chthoniobacterales bacterium]|jgi:hypothetical protein